MAVLIGIDPGMTGAVAVLREDEQTWETTVDVFDTPVTQVVVNKKKRHDYVIPEMLRILRDIGPVTVCVLEGVQPMPKNGSIGNFSLGRSTGVWEALLTAVGIPFVKVHSTRWKKAVLDGTGQDKGVSRLVAMRLFPAMASKLARVKDDGRAEAILMAEYGRRHLGGGSPKKEQPAQIDAPLRW